MINEFEYVAPASFSEAVTFLAQSDNACVLAGGTDLIVVMRAGDETPERVVDIKNIPGADTLVARRIGLTLGPAVTLNQLINCRGLKKKYAGLVAAAESIATYQLRNRATVIGNLCNASPAADMAPPLLVLDATLEIAGPTGAREMPLADFFTGVKNTALKSGELVTALKVPAPPPGTRSAFMKQQRLKGHDLATASVAAAFFPEKPGSSSGTLRLALGAVAVTPVRALDVQVKTTDVSKITKAALAAAQKCVSPIDDVRSSAEYRKQIIKVLISRLIPGILQ